MNGNLFIIYLSKLIRVNSKLIKFIQLKLKLDETITKK